MNKKRIKNIFKYILIIIIALALVASLIVIDKMNVDNNHYISEKEWVEQLSNCLDIDIESIESSSKNATGEYIAYTSTKILDSITKIDELIDIEKTKDNYINAAVNLNIIPRSQLKVNITEKAANRICNRIFDIYFNLDDYEEYCDIKYKDNVKDCKLIKIDENSKEIIATFNDAPQSGDKFTYKNEFGVSKIKKITSVVPNLNNEYKIKYEDIEDISEVVDSISFSGKGDFSYLDPKNKDNQSIETIYSMPEVKCAGISASYDNTQEEIDWTDPVDIKIKAVVKGKFENKTTSSNDDNGLAILKNNTKNKSSVSAEIQIKPKGVSSVLNKIKYEKNVDGTTSLSLCNDAVDGTVEFNKDNGNKKDSDTKLESLTVEPFEGSIELCLNDFVIGAKANLDLLNLDDAYVEICSKETVKLDFEFSNSIKSEGLFREQIASIPIPIVNTPLTVYLNLYLTFTIDGKVGIDFVWSNCNLGIKADLKNGISVPHSCEDFDINVSGKVDLETGIASEGELMLFDVLNIIDPGIEANAKYEYEILNKNKGFEEYEPCEQNTIMAPIIKADASIDKDSIIGGLLDKHKIKAELDVVSEDYIKEGHFLFVSKHTETDLNGKKNTLNGTADVCTHKNINDYNKNDLSKNPEASYFDIKAKELHFNGTVIYPKDVVLKMFDAMNKGKYETAVECLDPTSEKIFDFVGSIAAELNSYLTGKYKSWGQLVLESAGAQDVSLIECETIDLTLNNDDNVISNTLSKIPLVNNLYCTDATIRVKYRYVYSGKYHIIEEEYSVHRYSGYGWRINSFKTNTID